MAKRVGTAVVFTIVILAGILLQGWALRLLLLFAMLVSVSELYRAFRHLSAKPVCWVGYVYCALAVAAQSLGLQAWREPKLPGRYCPYSAALAMLRALRRAGGGC